MANLYTVARSETPGEHDMTRLLKLETLALLMMIAASALAQPPRGKVLAFFTTGGETDHYLFAQDAMRRLGANVATQGYSFAATSDWDALSDAGLKDVRLVISGNSLSRAHGGSVDVTPRVTMRLCAMPQSSSFKTVESIGRTLPDVEVTTAWGQPAVKVRGKMFVCIASHKSAEPNTLVVMMDFADRDALVEDDPDTYYLKEHYLNCCSLLPLDSSSGSVTILCGLASNPIGDS
jgi:hypothetical protein